MTAWFDEFQVIVAARAVADMGLDDDLSVGVARAVLASVDPYSSVHIPTTADEAALMVLLGTKHLEQHAPERLRRVGK